MAGHYTEEYQKKLNCLLIRLSKNEYSEQDINFAIKTFEELHDNRFYYKKAIVSDVVNTIQFKYNKENAKSSKQANIYKLPVDILKHNFDLIFNILDKQDDNDPLFNFIFKLYDYICLDIYKNDCNTKHIDALNAAKSQLEKSFNDTDMRNKLDTAAKNLKDSNSNMVLTKQALEQAQKTAEKLQTQMVSILGIFSAITISIFSSLCLFSSVFNNLDKISKYKLLFFTCLIGFVIFNIIALLLTYISTLFNKEYKKTTFHTLIKAVNFVIISMLVIVIVLWLFSQKITIPFS